MEACGSCLEGRLAFCEDISREACVMGSRPDFLRGCVGYWVLVDEDVLGGECVVVWLDVHMDGSR